MLHDRETPRALRPSEQVERLRTTYEGAWGPEVLQVMVDEFPGEVALVSSFGAEAAVLLHMAAEVDRDLPVLLVDTLMLFQETLDYQKTLSAHLGLRNVQHIRPNPVDLARADPAGTLHQRDTDSCCDIRKVLPLERALEPYSVLISGRKRYQAATRAKLEVFEADGERLKVNPLAGWSASDLRTYMDVNELPRHPLVAQGYPSIGCAPCTTRVAPGEDPRAGRWRGTDKVECGIHFGADGRILRAS
ncbi:phosphoadenylyl-sulfate reductase [Amaricoccus solimangrovi]|uniref:Adenosine 5'-phosphosulfate reductase n=1 Tax=Amaricoccus solimangrovi TaxID=2589815 RepID=A0A501WNU7_9RHOB|nr:phosphoadenylyl-sulfate reductase [Amaricoccus solimangrovi]TPE51413.1 phosphoadenylyl-sulfate reductase [Amaricoccus solimangrovi]